MSEEIKAGREIRNPGFSVKRFRNLYFADGLFELFVFLPFVFISWLRYLRGTDNASLVTVAGILVAASFIGIGILVYAFQNRRRTAMGVSPSILQVQICVVMLVLGLYAYLESGYVLEMPYISFVFLLVIWGVLAYLSRLMEFIAYLGWVLFSFLLTRMLVLNSGLELSAYTDIIYGFMTASLPIAFGLYKFINYVRHPVEYKKLSPGFESTEAEEGEGTEGSEQVPDIADFKKADELIKKTHGSYFDDGVFEIFFGLLWTLGALKQFIEVYRADYTQGFTTGFYAVMLAGLALMAIWNLRKYKILGAVVPGLELIVGPAVFLGAIMIGNRLGAPWLTATILILLFLTGAVWMKLKRCYIYAGWAFISFLATASAVRVFFTYEGKQFDLLNAYIFVFACSFLILGSIAIINFEREHLSGRARHIEPPIQDTNAGEVG